uniref:ataxin-10-like n=1 Tax=Styela clava TaxID=7725 RepID=UPI00193ACFF2|nr:ataxin-10-like [Styela clava]
MNYAELQNKFKNEEFRNCDHTQLYKELLNELIVVDQSKEEDQLILLDILRILRNSCIECQQNQNIVMKMNMPETVSKMVYNLNQNDKYIDKLYTCAFQFFGNFVAGNLETQKYFWNIVFPDFFIKFLCENQERENCTEICIMILYNCLLKNKIHQDDLFSNPEGERIVLAICNMVSQTELCSWVYLCVTNIFFNHPMFLPLLFSKSSDKIQLIVLQLYCDSREEENDANTTDSNRSNIMVLSEQFLIMYEVLCEGHSSSNIEFSAVLLDTLCWVTAISGSWNDEIDASKLIHSLIDLLKGLNLVGKNGKSNITDMPATKRSGLIQISDHAMPFKRSLVRLLGNLCYRNSKLQDDIRELGGIPLILECCNIDDNNPFMQQWALFAIRNLCENNAANQTEIKKLEKLGMADSPVLRDMGIAAVQDKDGNLRLEQQK